MSKILVNCVDQTLEVKQSPLIASGDVHTDEVDFDFCDEWKLYKKTAIFYRSPDKIYPVDVQVKSDGQNYCVIPYEVLRASGTMYFGVYGTLTIDAGTDDEEQRVRTSEVISYEIVQGAFAVTNVPDPTPNIYERLFNSIGILENLKTSNKSSAVAAINELAGKEAVIYTASITNKVVTSCTVNYAEAVEAFNAGRRVYCDIRCGASVFRAELDRYVKDGSAREDKYIYFNAIVHGGADHSDELWRATLSVDIENTTTYSEAKYDDGSTAGGGESVLYVNVTQSGSTITGDKTYAEILAAVTANKCVIAKFADANFYLDSVANDKIAFQRLNIGEDEQSRKSIDKQLVYVYNDGVWTLDVDFVAVDTAMSDTSEMPVQNKIVKAYIDGLAGDISGKQDKSTLEADVAAKGFTKNTGTYSKPAGGIPKADLAAAVQTSLGKADTALQEHQSLAAYRTAAAQDEIDSGKVDKVTGKGLSTNDYTAAAKAKVDAIPANPKYTDTVYDDTALKQRVATIEGKESAWDAKSDFSGSYNDLTDKPTIPTALPNPNALTFTGAVTGSYDGSAPLSVNIPSAVTDAHINELINAALNAIGVAEEGAY